MVPTSVSTNSSYPRVLVVSPGQGTATLASEPWLVFVNPFTLPIWGWGNEPRVPSWPRRRTLQLETPAAERLRRSREAGHRHALSARLEPESPRQSLWRRPVRVGRACGSRHLVMR